MNRLFSNKKISNSRQDIKGYYCYGCDGMCAVGCTSACSSSCSGGCSGGCKGGCHGTCNGVSTYS